MELAYKISNRQGHFTLPTTWMPQEAAARQRVAVVAVFGRSSLDAGGCKAAALEAMVGQRIFNRDLTHPIHVDQRTLTGVDGYYDVGRRTVYLHLTAAYDTSTLIASLEHMHQLLQEKGFLMAWSSLKLGFAKSLLVLFSVSHILLLCHPTHTFDVTYIHLFRTLDAIRSKAHNHLSELLRTVPGISKDWVAFGRLCAPRVLFLFSARLLPPQIRGSAEDGAAHRVRGGGGRCSAPSSPLRNLELALEDQIYRLLRKSRVITNISANSLFALPNNQAYVYIMEEPQPGTAAPPLIAATLHSLCGTPSAPSTPSAGDSLAADLTHLSLGMAGGRGQSVGGGRQDPTSATTANGLSASILSGVATERKRNLEHSFAIFLQQHIDQALGKGFDDNVGRHSGPLFFMVPRANVWFEAVNKIYNFFVSEPSEKDTKAKQVMSSLQNLVETEVRFSAARCAKILPLALSTYKDGLPPHYTQLHHQEKLVMALTVLSGQARGPMYEEYVSQLEEACERVWRDGRMGCEVLSLSGNTCQHPRHNTASEGDGEGVERGLPVMPHSSGVTYISFCNCGRRQGQREDPFTVHDANHLFYSLLADTCCTRLEAITFPTFKPSVSNARAAKVSGSEDDDSDTTTTITTTTTASTATSDLPRSDIDAPAQQLLPRDPTDSGTPHTPGLSLGGVGGLSGSVCGGATAGRMTGGEHSHGGGSQVVITLTKDDVRMIGKDRGIIRQASTTEYLPGMLTTASPSGLLAQYSSWALTCLGPSSLYSHNAGICDQPGFLPGTNFLLPWDVTVKIEDREKWPAIADTLGKKALLLKNKKNRCGDLHEFSVKIFLGVEYECKGGHRFMLASPDRHLKASPSGLVKDNATKIANADMPLYFPCPCSRSGGGIMNGQLMRLHIVTPKAPVNVTLSPQVQPAPDPCPRFIPQPPTSLPVKLSASAYWVLRLPYAYVGDQGPHYPPDPRQPTPPSYARLHKGCYGISQVTLDR
ncbi:nonsense-mediated mRNA decay factor SMG8-like [Eriocheir sinensis]|uniref:nonsense-mediated mRNA decay factor SMG8-like n=1 Tax=Eriocheir sinensis TaxID=95602 RepID=UPI0021CA11A7|nr:nonsense-mediated mRNA decay factor SMG8-like [Eriocheir sinensis]